MKDDKRSPSYYETVTNQPTWSEVFANCIENLQKEINSIYHEILDIKRRISDLESITRQEDNDHDN